MYGERAEQDLQTGSAGAAGALLRAMQSMTSGLGMVPEQAWEDPAVAASAYGSDPATASIGFANGKPAGSASPLIWAQAQYLRLVTDLGSGSLGDQPGIVANRYVRPAPPAGLTVSALSCIPNIVGRLRGQLLIDVARALAVFLLLFLGHRAGLSGMAVVKGYALLMVMNYLACYCLYSHQVKLVARTGLTGWNVPTAVP